MKTLLYKNLRPLIQKQSILFVFILFLSFSCTNDKKANQFVVKGYITGMFNGMAYLSKLSDGKLVDIDSAQMNKFKFKFKGSIEGDPELYYIRLKNKTDVMEFFLENSEIQIDADIGKLKDAQITGSKSQKEFQDFLENNAIFDNKQKGIYKQFEIARSSQDTTLILQLESDYQQVFEERKKFITQFATDHSESPSAALVVSRSLAEIISNELLEELTNKFILSQPNSVYTKELINKLKIRKKTAINQFAPEFATTNLEGELISLSSFRGKTVLLNFWMPKNGKSRVKNQFYKTVYEKYKSEKFEIVSVAISKDRDYCRNVVKADSTSWVQLSDFKGLDSPIVKQFGINNINTAFLIDKEGIILSKNFTDKELLKFMENIFKQ